MAAVEKTVAYCAFEKQLRTLCLEEFPCGTGSWRENKKIKGTSLSSNQKVEENFSVTLKEYGANHEKTEALEEFISMKRSPWKLDYTWSNEAKSLREIAVRSPWLINESFILNYFKTLRISDKNVEEVDERLLLFTNLEELTLSSNNIHCVNSENLPPNLKVLELCANHISDISGLCLRPVPLIHLGLGYNKVTHIGDYLTGDYWPHLLSLDLSHNNLSDLLDVIRKLGTMPKLRNLVLQGNPLSLIPGYRGYTIDSLRKLTMLDDIRISADERHHFKGLARRREFILDESKVSLEVHFLKGVPMPEELKNPDDQPEYPIVEKKYYVQFEYLADHSSKADIFQLDAEKDETQSILPCSENPDADLEDDSEAIKGNGDEQTDIPKIVLFAEKTEIAPTPIKAAETTESRMTNPLGEEVSPSQASYQGQTTQMSFTPIRSDLLPWEEEIEYNWSTAVVRDDLVQLRNFFKQGMELKVLEEKVLATPAEPGDDGSSSPSSRKGDKGKADKNKKPDKKKEDKGKGGKDKKKKKGEEEELVRSPPEVITIATFHIGMEELLEGEFDLEYHFTKVMGDGTEEEQAIQKRKDGKKDLSKKGRDSPRRKDDLKMKEKAAPRSARSKETDKKDAKGKGKVADEDSDDPPPPPPPLEVSVAVRLHHWKTAYDSVKDEEARNKELAAVQAKAP